MKESFYFLYTVLCPPLSCLSCFALYFVGALPLSVSLYCPPVCMPATGCQPIRPPGQFFQPLTLLQCHQHRQGSQRGHRLLPLLWNLRPEGGQHFDALPGRGHLTGNCADSRSNIATCWGATANAASYHFTYRWVIGSEKEWEGGKIGWKMTGQLKINIWKI